MAYVDLQAPNGMTVKVDSSKKEKIKNLIRDGFIDLSPPKVVKPKVEKPKNKKDK